MNGLFDPRREHDACGVGFTARLDGRPSHELIQTALTAMARMAHRGGGDGKTGDGAGVLFPLPKAFFLRQWPLLQNTQFWAVGQLFLPVDRALQNMAMAQLHADFARFGLRIADGRAVPVARDVVVGAARASMPDMQQILVLPDAAPADAEAFERRLFIARHVAENAIWTLFAARGVDTRAFYVSSLSSRSIVYKGMLPGGRLGDFYEDLREPDCTAPFAVFHERFSTNTLPAWPLAQPFRLVAHNGEINTLCGNVARMSTRENSMASDLLPDLRLALPILTDFTSDSGKFDNVLELLVRGGRSLTHALMMMVPEPFGSTFVMGDNKRAFYEYHAALMEPWDGPTAMVFTDGYRRVGALLDRNGLRPCRYSASQDGVVVLGSETGIADLDPKRTIQRGQLRPRRMILADIEHHRLAPDAEIKGRVIRETPYRRWLMQNTVRLENLHHTAPSRPLPPLIERQRGFGYDQDWIKRVLLPMANNAQEPVESMGNDLPLACLNEHPQTLFHYFKQRFAQVTNPPIDPLREQLSMSLMGFAGREGNILDPRPESYALLRLPHPFLTADDIRRIRGAELPAVRARTLDATFPAGSGGNGLRQALRDLFAKAADALEQGATILILSDTAMSRQRTPLPILLATAGLHHFLIRKRVRHACGTIVETGEAREVIHMAQLIGYGASAIYPHTLLDSVERLAADGKLAEAAYEAQENTITALKKGLLKAFARLGISTLRSFLGSQPFEAVGLARDVVDEHFTGTPCAVGGVSLDQLADEADARHAASFADEHAPAARSALVRLWTPESVRTLHTAVRTNDADAYRSFAAHNDVQPRPFTLRALLRLKPGVPVPLEEVESAASLCRRFVGAGISLGAISDEAHRVIAEACNHLGARSNGGEGGEDPARNRLTPDGLDPRSHVRQLAAGRFGATAEFLTFADEIQIKVAQGAKPGEGGQLPGYKVFAEIARIRGTMPGVTLISPPPHHDIYSIEDLSQLIHDLRHFHPTARISVKLVSETGVGTVAVGVAKAGAHLVLISGHDGGTGASPHSAINAVGLPWELGLAETQQALIASGLRGSVTIQTDGLLRSGRDVAVAALLGAEEFGFGTALLVSMGCVMCRSCMKGRCPVGIATQDPALRKRFAGKVEYVERYLRFVAEDLRRHMAALGFRTLEEMVGRADRLEQVREGLPPKASSLDLSALLAVGDMQAGPRHAAGGALAPLPETPLEQALNQAAAPLLDGRAAQACFEGTVHNTDRSVGSRLSGEIVRRAGAAGWNRDSFAVCLHGQAGQSLGAFLAPGVTLAVQGEANDYAGKGLSGGILVVRPENGVPFVAADQAIVGNVALYGASAGEAYFCGQAGERFAVRNSGATAVVEGVGDHGCEYMTGGVVVVLGPCGYNFAAGMSGGVAFAYDASELFQNRCNLEGVDLESVWMDKDTTLLHHLLEEHLRRTGSRKAATLLENWDAALPLFVKVMPLDFRKALRRQAEAILRDGETAAATEEVFH